MTNGKVCNMSSKGSDHSHFSPGFRHQCIKGGGEHHGSAFQFYLNATRIS